MTATTDRPPRASATPAGILAVVLAVVGLSAGSTLVKEVGAPGVIVAFWRLVVGAAIWQVVLAVGRKRITWRTLRLAGLSGVFFGADLALFFVAVTRTRVANAEFIGSLTPVFVVPLAAVIFHEHVPRRALTWGATAIAGVAVVLFAAPSSGSRSWTGDLYAMLAVLTWVGYLLTAKRARVALSTAEFMGTVAVVASLVLAPMAVARGGLFDLDAKGWVLVVLLGILTGTAAHGLLVWAQRHVPVSTISVLSLAQPALATLWAFLVLGEGIEPLQVVGGGIVLASLLLFTREVNRR